MNAKTQFDRIFNPRSVAVVGASTNPEKPGFMCLENLLDSGFKGKIYPVNPFLSEAFGLKAYSTISAIPGEIDLVLIVIPAQQTIPVIEECIAKGVQGVVMVSGGFKEVGTSLGAELQVKIGEMGRKSGMKIIGPNTMGLVSPHVQLNASFQQTLTLAKPGNVAVAGQSGGMTIYIVHALTNFNIGISKGLGMGNRCAVDFDEVVSYFGQDDETKLIALYLEGLEQPQKLMQVAREVVRMKPILAYKAGRAEGIERATFSHTGALAGEDKFYRAAFRQCGIIDVEDVTELIDMAKALTMQPPAPGNRIAVLSVQAGPGIVMADKSRRMGLELAQFSAATKGKLRALASPLNSIDNPVDIAWRNSDFNACRGMMQAVLDDDGVDGVVLAELCFPPGADIFRAVIDIAGYRNKPITVCTDSPRGESYVELHALEENHIPAYPLPERAVTGMAGLARYGEVLKRAGQLL